MKQIHPHPIYDCTVSVPGSKSYTHRALIAAALSTGRCRILGALDSEDTRLTREALSAMGVPFDLLEDAILVQGVGKELMLPGKEIFLGNSGTSMRLLTGIAALGNGETVLTGTKRMQERPIKHLLQALGMLGVDAQSVNRNGCPPVRIKGGFPGGKAEIDLSVSSQYLSGLLLAGPYTEKGVDIAVVRGPVSRPYIRMTIQVMKDFGVEVEQKDYTGFRVESGQSYWREQYRVEPDASQAGYFWAAGALTGKAVTVAGINRNSIQGDLHLASVFEKMGCRVVYSQKGITVKGEGQLQAIHADMGDMPDMVPTLAVAAAYAKGTTRISNAAHLVEKESNRLTAVAAGLDRMGIIARVTDDGLEIDGGDPRGAVIDTFDDHRIAMSFAVAGLVTPGVGIRNEKTVEKSFPNFWEVFEGMQAI